MSEAVGRAREVSFFLQPPSPPRSPTFPSLLPSFNMSESRNQENRRAGLSSSPPRCLLSPPRHSSHPPRASAAHPLALPFARDTARGDSALPRLFPSCHISHTCISSLPSHQPTSPSLSSRPPSSDVAVRSSRLRFASRRCADPASSLPSVSSSTIPLPWGPLLSPSSCPLMLLARWNGWPWW